MKIDILMQKVSIAGLLPVFCPKGEEELNTFFAAILKAELPAVEITLRNDYALTAIERIKTASPLLLVGAGTVMKEEQADAAKKVGADFLVSPGYTPQLVTYAERLGLPFIPGCSTPSEIQIAIRAGLSYLKLFPAECLGGVSLLKLYEGAFSSVSFLPTGGITAENLTDYLACANVVACGGSFMIDKKRLALGDADGIADNIKRIMKK